MSIKSNLSKGSYKTRDKLKNKPPVIKKSNNKNGSVKITRSKKT